MGLALLLLVVEPKHFFAINSYDLIELDDEINIDDGKVVITGSDG